LGCPAAPGLEEGPPSDGPGGKRSKKYPGGHSQSGGGGPLAQFGATGAALATEEEQGPEGGRRNPGAGKGQRKRRWPRKRSNVGMRRRLRGELQCSKERGARHASEAGPPAGPVGHEGGVERENKKDDGATGVAKPKVAAGEATHPAPPGARGEGGGPRAMDARSLGAAGPDGEAEDGEADILPGKKAS
ncbi:uncharacterized protein Dana_GF27815, partial [Drosophila ananassae]